MKILSYQDLTQMKPVYAARTEKPASATVFDFTAWQQEVITVIGSRQGCRAFLSQVVLKAGIASSTEAAQAMVGENLDLLYEQKLINAATSLADLFAAIINNEENKFSKAEKEFLLKQVLLAGYLQPYATFTYAQLSHPVRQRVLLVYQFLHHNYILLPDLLSVEAEYDKILLHKTLQNLRLLFTELKTIFIFTQNTDEAIFLSDRVLVITQTAGQINTMITVAFKEPRHRHIIGQLPAFKVIRKKLIFALTDVFAPSDLLLPTSINLLS